MKFPVLEIENFLSIGTATIKLADRGLVLVQGVNEADSSADSNGSGKSSIPDAMCWCLYGTTARGESGDTVVNRVNKKNTRVVLSVQDGDDLWQIMRHRKHKIGKNNLQVWKSVSGSWQDFTKGTDKLTQELVNSIIGSSYEVFRAAIYAGQEDMADLPGMTDKNLKLLVEEAAGVTILEEAYAIARANLYEIETDIEELERKRSAVEDRVTIFSDEIKSCLDEKAAWEDNHEIKLTALSEEGKKFVARTLELNKELKTYDREQVEKKLADISTRLGAVHHEQLELTNLNNKYTSLVSSHAALGVTKSSLLRLKESQEKTLKNVAHKIGCPCETCGRPLTADELSSVTEAAQKKLDQTLSELTQIDLDIGDTHKRSETALRDAKAFESSMTDVSAEMTLSERLNEKMKIISDLTNRAATERRHAEFALKAFHKEREEVNPHNNRLDRLNKECGEAVARLDRMNEKMTILEDRKAVQESVVEVFSPAGVRARILDEVTPFLNDQTARWLSTLSDGNITATWTTLVKNAKGDLREKFSIEITTATAGETFKSISGGEKRKIRIATALALQDLVARRAMKPIELFIGDEIDGALDTSGVERLTTILEEKARERGSVFIISHNSLRDWVSQVMTVRKDATGVSTIEEL